MLDQKQGEGGDFKGKDEVEAYQTSANLLSEGKCPPYFLYSSQLNTHLLQVNPSIDYENECF